MDLYFIIIFEPTQAVDVDIWSKSFGQKSVEGQNDSRNDRPWSVKKKKKSALICFQLSSPPVSLLCTNI